MEFPLKISLIKKVQLFQEILDLDRYYSKVALPAYYLHSKDQSGHLSTPAPTWFIEKKILRAFYADFP